MNRPITLKDLYAMLIQLEKVADDTNRMCLGTLPEGDIVQSMKTLIDKYDIRKSLRGKGTHTRSTSYPSVYSNPWKKMDLNSFINPYASYFSFPPLTYSVSPPISVNYAFGTTVDDVEEKEKKRQIEQFEEKVDCVRQCSAFSVDNPGSHNEERTPDYVHTLTSWRGWKVKDRKLFGIGKHFLWTPGKAFPSSCHDNYFFDQDEHEAPHNTCKCGYWSFRNLDLLKKALHDYIKDVDVVGTVEIWGRVVECENGYRSEFAYPKELWLLKTGLEYLSYIYNVPVRVMEKNGDKRK